MNARKQLLVSIAVVPGLFVLGAIAAALLPSPAPRGMNGVAVAFMVLAYGWGWLGLAYMAARHARELGMPGGVMGLFSVFFPIVVPCVLAGVARAPAPALSAGMRFNGRAFGGWGLGEPRTAHRTRSFLGLGGRVLIHADGGLITDRGPGASGVRWEAVREIYQDLADQYVNGVHTRRQRRYTLRADGGARVIVDDRYEGIDELGPILQQRVCEALRPAAVAALEQGGTLGYGPVTLAPAGIEVKGKGLPWGEVGDIVVDSGYLVVTRVPAGGAGEAVQRSVETVAGVLSRIVGTAQPMLGRGAGIQWRKVPARAVPNLALVVELSRAMARA